LIGSGVVCSTLTTILHKVIQRGCMCGLKQIRQYLCWEGSGMGDAGLTDLHDAGPSQSCSIESPLPKHCLT
jgi:hypothetical protein